MDAQLNPTPLPIVVPLSASTRILLSAMLSLARLTRLQPNVFRLDRIGAGR
jgi:hypothetical protein